MARTLDIESGAGLQPDPEKDSAGTVVATPASSQALAEAGPGQAVEAMPATAPGRGGRRRLVLLATLVVALGAGGYYGYDWWTNGRFIVSTDDAYVAAKTAAVTPQISGYVKSVPAADNTHVRVGDPLIVLDDSGYRIALAQAEAQIATEEASIARIGEQINAGKAAVRQAEAQLGSARAAADNARADHDRVSALEAKAVVATKLLDAARATMIQADSAVTGAEAAVTVAKANAAVAMSQKAEAERVLDQYRLARDQAQLDLDHTVIRAPFAGVVGNGAAEPGEFVQPGQRLLAVIPLDDIYIDANFKETQVEEIKPGQSVAITVDAYPGRTIEGIVESVAPASGSVFSLLPPENATGNFTKVVQRVPVRIRLPKSVAEEGLIRPGMSIVAEVDTRTGPSRTASR
ncbi:HlyD family secretion protein [Bauldia litoralis]|uniref:Membrane fusion protein, multidrug efflux system n=1 Tax=Bauldia litoralis TaxID=665467 RepID=A0A1G6AI16_9HYPH|nr:HlyD family secretion protein [Bauldia litoralis]SDB07970.1 membrane fusion protein, multidrug efflux system [Bauldia litoralis]